MKDSSIICLIVLFFVSSFSFASFGQPIIKYDEHNNVFLWGCTYNGDERGIYTNILDITGGSGNYTITCSPEISINEINLGNKITYEIFVPIQTNMNDIYFTITDLQGGAVGIDEDVRSLLDYASNTAYEECLAPEKCEINDIVHPAGERLYPDTYYAKNSITSSAILSDRNTKFIASESITLLGGFTSINLTNFTAEIGNGCD